MEIGAVLVADKIICQISIGCLQKHQRPQYDGKTNNIGWLTTQIGHTNLFIFLVHICWPSFASLRHDSAACGMDPVWVFSACHRVEGSHD